VLLILVDQAAGIENSTVVEVGALANLAHIHVLLTVFFNYTIITLVRSSRYSVFVSILRSVDLIIHLTAFLFCRSDLFQLSSRF